MRARELRTLPTRRMPEPVTSSKSTAGPAGELPQAGADLELGVDRLGDPPQLPARGERLEERPQRLPPAGSGEDRHVTGRTNAPCPAGPTTSPSRATSTPRTSTRRMRPATARPS